MALRLRKSLFTACIPAFLVTLILPHAPAWGEEGAKGTREVVAAIPAEAPQPAGKMDDEIEKARLGVKAEPVNASVHTRLGYLLIGKGALDEAMGSFDEALKLNSRAYEAKTGKGVVLARKGNLKDAEQALKDALLLNPNPVRTHYELGLVYEKLGDSEKAVAEFKEGIRKHEQGRQ